MPNTQFTFLDNSKVILRGIASRISEFQSTVRFRIL